MTILLVRTAINAQINNNHQEFFCGISKLHNKQLLMNVRHRKLRIIANYSFKEMYMRQTMNAVIIGIHSSLIGIDKQRFTGILGFYNFHKSITMTTFKF